MKILRLFSGDSVEEFRAAPGHEPADGPSAGCKLAAFWAIDLHVAADGIRCSQPAAAVTREGALRIDDALGRMDRFAGRSLGRVFAFR